MGRWQRRGEEGQEKGSRGYVMGRRREEAGPGTREREGQRKEEGKGHTGVSGLRDRGVPGAQDEEEEAIVIWKQQTKHWTQDVVIFTPLTAEIPVFSLVLQTISLARSQVSFVHHEETLVLSGKTPTCGFKGLRDLFLFFTWLRVCPRLCFFESVCLEVVRVRGDSRAKDNTVLGACCRCQA